MSMRHVNKESDLHQRATPAWTRTVTKTIYWITALGLLFVLVGAYAGNEEAKERAASYAKRVISENDRYKNWDQAVYEQVWRSIIVAGRPAIGCYCSR
jgi:hypothetical protein